MLRKGTQTCLLALCNSMKIARCASTLTRKATVPQLYISTPQRSYLHTHSTTISNAARIPEGVEVTWPSGTKTVYHPTWLRHNCQCPSCIEPNSKQRILPVQSLHNPAETEINSVLISEVGLSVEWKSGHISQYPPSFLLMYPPESKEQLAKKSQALRPPDRPVFPTMDISEVLGSNQGLFHWLDVLTKSGACLLSGAGTEPGKVVELANRISSVQNTIYGTTFDVVSQAVPINVAYSPLGLEFHQDLAYYESPPGLQFLHCLRFDKSVVGGDSSLSDLFSAAQFLRDNHPEEFKTLCTVPACFAKVHYQREHPVHITYQRPIIAVNRFNEIVTVTWAPPFEAPLQDVSLAETDAYYKAYMLFDKILPSHETYLRLQPGQILTFNNRRMAHGRVKFELGPDAQRHLEGAYVHIDEFRSKHRVLQQQLYGWTHPTPRIGNGDMQ